MTSNETLPAVKSGSRGLVINDMEGMWRLAQAVYKAPDMRPKNMDTPEKIMVAMQYGGELGMSPMQAINSIAIINGKPSVYGEALIAVANASGLIKDVIETTEETAGGMTAKCTIIRQDGRETTGEFSEADAKKANLWGKTGPWSSYPKRMLMWRARGFAYRDGVPEALRGLWFREEVNDVPLRDVTPTPHEPPQERDPLMMIDAPAQEDGVIEPDQTDAPPDQAPAPAPADPPGTPLDEAAILSTAEKQADLGYVQLEKHAKSLSTAGQDVIRLVWDQLKERAVKADIGPIGA